jgi:hypothetical protein
MDHTILDAILLLQLTVARLGEKELMNWWNTDIVYKLGGADFLQRLVGPRMAPLSAGEAVLLAAQRKEEKIIATIPGHATYSLFCPLPSVRAALSQRFRHYKTYLDDMPTAVEEILNPDTEWQISDLCARLQTFPKADFLNTSFGRELSRNPNVYELELAQALASTFSAADKGDYVMPYYRIADAQ